MRARNESTNSFVDSRPLTRARDRWTTPSPSFSLDQFQLSKLFIDYLLAGSFDATNFKFKKISICFLDFLKRGKHSRRDEYWWVYLLTQL